MYFNILKKDLKRKKTMNIILLIFIIISKNKCAAKIFIRKLLVSITFIWIPIIKIIIVRTNAILPYNKFLTIFFIFFKISINIESKYYNYL